MQLQLALRDTSLAAYASVLPKLRKLQQLVLDYAKSAGTFTDPDLQAHFGTPGSTHRTRRSELVKLGLIVDTGQRTTREGSNRRYIVWTAA